MTKTIRVEIEVDDCVRCPSDAEDLSDLLYGIGDGQVDGCVTITDSPVVPDDAVLPCPLVEGVTAYNVDGMGPVVPLDGLAKILKLLRIPDVKQEQLETGIQTVEAINRVTKKRPVVRLADEFYPEAV